ncbi:DNA polymerase IV [Paenibacillus sp. LMG 31456]|uniref:DNA polymerase IV n=1 Tax=Paenibacillus foliorum TaxID=2654974 RepID=A0A972GLX2_9BACL|nr:DNA polymerase IV [Paenibacillus foliorum]NOU92683.1 DNA polymerase IV [Paenibacillus foliorum]
MGSKQQRVIFLADCQSFYASVEKAAHPEYKDKPLVVAGDPARRSGIILAACPIAKDYGVTTAERLGESLSKCPELIIVKPRMQMYIDVSLRITEIYESFTDLVEPFSIDEQFLDVTNSVGMFGSPTEMAKQIQTQIKLATGVFSRVGISSTKMLAKMACDNFAKKNAEGIYMMPKETISEDLWKQPIEKMFGVGSRMKKHFFQLGIHSIGDLAQTPLPRLRSLLKAKFGKNADIHADLLWQTANGIDDSRVTPSTHRVAPKSIGHMMTLPRDYVTGEEIDTILLELTEEICRDARRKRYMGSTVTVGCMCSPFDAPTGFSRQMTMPDPTNNTDTVYKAARSLFYRFWDGMPVRRAGVTISGLVKDEEYQLTMFDNQERQRALEKATDYIKDRFGSAAIIRASSAGIAGQAQHRSLKIGGHYK